MQTLYGCPSCGARFSVGCYHDFSGHWYNALYCRECGNLFHLKQTIEQFLAAFAGAGDRPEVYSYELIGPGEPKEVVLKRGAPPPQVKCDCGAQGPFGSLGPITDSPPGSICPYCRQPTLEYTGELIT